MRLPAVGSEGLARAVEGFVSESEGSGNFSGLKAVADILYAAAREHSQTGNISRIGVLEWMEAAKSAYTSALDAYRAQQAQAPGFAEEVEGRIAEIVRMEEHSSPYGTQRARLEDELAGRGLEPMPAPQPEPRRLRVAVMDR